VSYFTCRADIPEPLKQPGSRTAINMTLLHWLEREVTFLGDSIEAVEGRLLIKIVRKPCKSTGRDTEPGETDHA
jgi:hypothetical protein